MTADVFEATYPENTFVLREGESGDTAFFIVAGYVQVLRGDTVVADLGPDEVFGEMALLDPGPRAASVRTRSACRVIVCRRRFLDTALADAGPIVAYMVKKLINRVRDEAAAAVADADDAAAVRHELDLIQWFDTVLSDGHLRAAYQPVFPAGAHQPKAYEMLLRCRTADGDLTGPGAFLDAAKRFRRTADVTEATVTMACREFAAHAPHDGSVLAINVENEDLFNPDFADRVLAAVDRTALSPDRVEIEITERYAVDDIATVAGRLQRLRDAGIGVALDDFGTGYTSLQLLFGLPITKLKIDKHYVARYPTDLAARTLVQTALDVARTLGLRTVAEGVSTPEIAQAMTEAGVDDLQGFLLGRPAAAGTIWSDRIYDGAMAVS